MMKYSLLLALLMAIIFPLWPQTETDDPALLIGYSLADLIRRFGVPRSVYPVRGVEEWADDVVFVYDEGDFYIIKDRVWQVGLKSAYQVKAGDSWSTVSYNLGQALSSGWDYVVFPLRGQSWPLALRCNFDSEGRVTVIFIYRSDL
jgi:hypothetical protein